MPPDAITSRPTRPKGSFSEFASTPSAAEYRVRSARSSMKKSRISARTRIRSGALVDRVRVPE